MKLTILGSGTTFPKADAGSAGYLLESGETKLLFDLGLGTLHKLDRQGIDVRKLRHIFLTHLHADHVCELAPLLFYLTVVKKTRMEDPVNQDISFTLYGPKGTKEFVQKLWDITKV
ncbi:MBL fold metallo-hydrolase, partial [Candidatus Woesearchaeota archaeon]|nr:MBL fold metallo-hydrolase [Candidatus Woesearchaeota archaeon]